MGVTITRNQTGVAVGPAGPSGQAGPVGPPGPSGLGFDIARVYPSSTALLADNPPAGFVVGQFGIVSSANPDNTSLYLWQGVGPGWLFIDKLSAGVPLPGPVGPPGGSGPVGPAGPQGSSLMSFLGVIDATAGLAVGVHPVIGVIPGNFVITKAFMVIMLPFTSAGGTATMTVEVTTPEDLLGITPAVDLPASHSYDLVPNSAGNDIYTTVAVTPILTVGIEPLTGGLARVYALLAAVA